MMQVCQDHKHSRKKRNHLKDFPGGAVVKNPPAKARNTGDMGSMPGSRRALGRKWETTSVFLPGKFHGQRNLACYSLCGYKKSDMTEHA